MRISETPVGPQQVEMMQRRALVCVQTYAPDDAAETDVRIGNADGVL